jgi:hypothetical protein
MEQGSPGCRHRPRYCPLRCFSASQTLLPPKCQLLRQLPSGEPVCRADTGGQRGFLSGQLLGPFQTSDQAPPEVLSTESEVESSDGDRVAGGEFHGARQSRTDAEPVDLPLGPWVCTSNVVRPVALLSKPGVR